MIGSSRLRVKIKKDRLAVTAVTLAPILYFITPILKGHVLCPDDGILQNVPFRVAAAQMLKSGFLPLWDPYIFSGMPFLAAAQAGILYPLNWFYLIFSPAAATNLMVVSSYMVAGVGAYLYARRIGTSVSGSMLTALVWQFSGALVGQIAHINIVQNSAILPWLLWSIEAYAQTIKLRHGVLLAALLALQFFAGHQQTFAYSLILIAAYAITMSLSNESLRKRYLSALLFMVSGLMLAAVQILPTFELLRNSLRATATYDFFISFSMPRRFVLTWLAPYVMGGGDGRLFAAPYVGPPFYQEMIGYVGLLAVMLAIIAVLIKRDPRTKFWAVIAALAFILALGGYAPSSFYKFIYHVPVLNLFRVPARHLMEVDFALAVLAGRGLSVLSRGRPELRTKLIVASVAILVLIATLLTVTVLRPAEFHLARTAPVDLLHAPELFLPLLFAGASAGALWIFMCNQRRGIAAIFIVLILDLAVWGQASGWYNGGARVNHEYWHEPETVHLLRSLMKDDKSPQRILTAPHTFDPAVAPVPPSVSHSTDWVLWTQPDVYMLHGIQNAAGYDGFGLQRYSDLAGRMKVWGELTDPDSTLRSPSREIDLTNARFLVAMRTQPQAKTQTSIFDQFAPATEQHGEFKFAATDLALPAIAKDQRVAFSVPPTDIDRVALMTNLAWSENIPDNAMVARLRLKLADGGTVELPIRAGADTAEWAHDRHDINARIRHRRATVATSYDVNDASGRYQAHTYLASLSLPRLAKVVSGEIVPEQISNAPDLTLSVFRVSLANSTSGETYALRRDSVAVERTASAANPPAISANERWKLAAQTKYVQIYENTHALPRAWLTSDVRVLDEPATLEVIRNGKFQDGTNWQPEKTALIDHAIGEKQPGELDGSAAITKYEPNRIELETKANQPAILVLSENHYPGWRAYIDGRFTDTLRVDYNLRGVAVPAGEHKVEFIYRPKSVLIGFAISLLALIGLMVAPFAAPVVKRISPRINTD
jgi:hypothetical protein